MSTPENNAKRKRIKKRRNYWLHKIKTSAGCENCGYNKKGYALVFAHKNPMEKHPICCGQGRGGAGMNGLVKRICTANKEKNRKYIRELFEEIRKCKILCMNCHTEETIEAGEHENNFEISQLRNNKELKTEQNTLDGFFG
tara:strand:- start:36 stop:458 length:423 start_codon:yes stop_codon:yes gene_type:complete